MIKTRRIRLSFFLLAVSAVFTACCFMPEPRELTGIYFRATDEDIAAGRFFIEFHEHIPQPVTFTRVVAWETSSNQNLITPFISQGNGSFYLDETKGEATFTFNDGNAEVIYGYEVTPSAGTGLFYVSKDITVVPVRNLIDGSILFETGSIDVYFDIPSNYELYVPWEKIGEKHYLIPGDIFVNKVWKGGVIYWGHFAQHRAVATGDHLLNMLSVDSSPVQNTFDFLESAYKQIMKLFAGTHDYYTDSESIVIMPPGSSFGIEGTRGAFAVTADDTSFSFPADPASAYIDYVASYVHMLVHATFDDPLPGWWTIEGPADYYKYQLLADIGFASQAVVDAGFAEIVTYYRNEILANNLDIPLAIKTDLTPNPEQLYPVTITENIPWMFAGKQYQHNLGSSMTSWFVYSKGSLIFLLADLILKEETGGTYNLDDLLNWYLVTIQRNWDDNDPETDNEDRESIFENGLGYLTGNDHSDFIDRWVYNAEPLPLTVSNGKVILNYQI